MPTDDSDLLSRYLEFSRESATLINKALSAVKPDVDRAFAADPQAREALYRLNDLQLFLLQVIAFDGFVTKCMHAARLPKKKTRIPCLAARLDELADETLRKGDRYKALRSRVEDITKVRNAWAHRLCDPSTSQDLSDLQDRFGLYEQDGSLWLTLPHVSQDRCQVWSFVVCTLHQMAELIWPCVQATTQRLQQE